MTPSESIHICPPFITPCNPVSTYADGYLISQICYCSTLPTSECRTLILAVLLVLMTKTDYLHSKRVLSLSRSAFQLATNTIEGNVERNTSFSGLLHFITDQLPFFKLHTTQISERRRVKTFSSNDDFY